MERSNMETPEGTRKLTRSTILSFGIGNAAEGVKTTVYGGFILFYYQQVLGVSGSLAGLALAISVFVDAITDPIVGQVSDRLNTRWGRRHPYMAIAAIPLSISFFLLFNPPEDLSSLSVFIWLLVFAVLARVSLTFYEVPHMALGAEMATDYHQRTTLFSISAGFRMVSGLAITFVAYRFIFPTTEDFNPGLLNPEGYFFLGALCGVVIIIALTVCVIGTRHEIPYLQKAEKSGSFSAWNAIMDMFQLLKNSSFRAIVLGLFFFMLIVNIEQGLSPYTAIHFWGLSTENMSFFPIAQFAGALAALPMLQLCTRLFDKKNVLIGVTIMFFINVNIFICARLFFPLIFPGNDSPLIFAFVLIYYFFVGFVSISILTTINSMIADVADEYASESGLRREGSFYAARSFASKSAGAAGLVLTGVVLDFIQFPEGAVVGSVTDQTLWSLGFFHGPGTSIFMIITIFLYTRYRITRESTIESQRRIKLNHQQNKYPESE
jgi:Na+/melibiose symporter-like transporter